MAIRRSQRAIGLSGWGRVGSYTQFAGNDMTGNPSHSEPPHAVEAAAGGRCMVTFLWKPPWHRHVLLQSITAAAGHRWASVRFRFVLIH